MTETESKLIDELATALEACVTETVPADPEDMRDRILSINATAREALAKVKPPEFIPTETERTRKRWTIGQIRQANLKSGGYFFRPGNLRFAGETMRDWSVRHHNGKIYVVNRRKNRVHEFNPRTARLGPHIEPAERPAALR